MKLNEKILYYRKAAKLSQEALAERIGVSRQAVSKWELGDAAPEVEKLLLLARAFGVTVDELVRDGEMSEQERNTADPDAESRIIYVERRRRMELTPVQILGVIGIVTGAALFFLGAIRRHDWMLWGLLLVILSLPLLLAKKYPWRIVGLLLLLGLYAVYNPWTTGGMVRWGIVDGIVTLNKYLRTSNFTTWSYRSYLFGIAAAMIRGILTLPLVCYAGWSLLEAVEKLDAGRSGNGQPVIRQVR